MTNATIGHYTIIEELGRGGMAVVYRASDRTLDREVALKVLPREFLHDPTFRKRFTREAQTIAGLEHPAIVPVYDFGEDDGQPFFVMRYMPGGSLSDILRRGPLSLEDTKKIIYRISSALDAAHARAIIHRDVKPGNILFDSYSEAYLSDFGIVRLTEATSQLTGGGIVGTPAYMAPEMSHRGGLTNLIDVYALGVTLFEILSGCQPYQADTPMGTALAHTTNPIPDIRSIRPELPASVQSVVNQGMAKDPTERYQSAGELVKGLREVLNTASVGVPVTGPEEQPPLTHKTEADVVDSTLPEGLVEPTLPEIEPLPSAPVQTVPDRKPKPWLRVAAGSGVIGVVVLVGVIVAALLGVFNRPAEPGQQEMESIAEEPTDIPEPIEEPTAIPTPTSTETPEPTQPSLRLGFNPVINNADWEPVIEKINGFEMVLVPAGCFQMGSSEEELEYAYNLCQEEGNCERAKYNDESPRHEVCFEEPYWIDVYEVTNKQYGSTGCEESSSEPNQPRNCVSWLEAQAYCESRDARLPTEAEWEYAARGPDSLIYPWGNVFIPEYVVYGGNSDGYTREVGSRPNGVSWVGAYDLSGNVWEWVNDWYESTYYSTLSGSIINPQGPSSGIYRGTRGGAWFLSDRGLQRSADRVGNYAEYSEFNIGLRCARSYSPTD